MSQRNLCQLPPETIRLITSSQVITSVATAVKELVENSIDADSRNIQVRLENYGFDTLEVKDDGHGVSYDNVHRMFLPGYTSKISCFDDLEKLESYGFRGEALASLVKIANVTVTTKTAADTLAMTYVIDSHGVPQSSKPCHLAKGTIISATNIFGNLPVRKQYLSSKKKVGEVLKKVELVVQQLSAIHPELRISLVHNKSAIWHKNAVRGIQQSFMQVMGLRTVSKLEHLNELQNNIFVDLILPKKGLDNIDNLFTSSSQSVFSYVNRRPVVLSKIFKLIMEHLKLQFSALNPTGKYAVCLVSVEVPPKEVDVNLEPNKTKVYLKNETDVMDVLDQMLMTYYGQTIDRPKEVVEEEEPKEVSTLEEDPKDMTIPGEKEPMEVGDEEDRVRKRPRLEQKKPNEMVTTPGDKEFLENLEAIVPAEKMAGPSLCSQINRQNCTLTTSQEKMELNRLISGNINTSLVTSLNVSPREQSGLHRPVEDKGPKPILPDWPVRAVHTEKQKPDSSIRPVSVQDLCDKVEEAEPLDDAKVNDLLQVDLVDVVDMNAWSRGVLEINGERLQGGAALAKPVIDDAMEKDVELFDMSMRSVSSQMGKKELSAFTKFARIVRPKILEEFPGMIFTKVASLLVDRWKALAPDERKYYERIAKEVDARREAHLEEVKARTEPESKKKKKQQETKPVRSEVKIMASLETIMEKKKRIPRQQRQDEIIRVVGQLHPSGHWLYRKGRELGHIRHVGLHELILSQRMFSTHTVPCEPAPNPMYIDEDVLGRDLWAVLLRLEMERDPTSCRMIVTSPVVTKNGFKVELETKNGAVVRGWITEVASIIPFYGVADLKDCLKQWRSRGESGDLAKLRTVPVINYITNEAIRMVQQAPRLVESSDLREWIKAWETEMIHLPGVCLHSRDIFVPIYVMRAQRGKEGAWCGV